MQTITKQQAATLYGNGFKILESETDIKYSIVELRKNKIKLQSSAIFKTIYFDKIGVDYHILARPLDLTKEITHKGETFVPIVELAKIYQKFIVWQFKENKAYYDRGDKNTNTWFDFNIRMNSFIAYSIPHEFTNHPRHSVVNGQDVLFDKLRKWNFAINLPDGSWIPVTEQNNPYK